MSFNTQSGFTTPQTVVLSGGVSIAKTSPICLSATISTNGNTTIGTVGAGKKWTILGYTLGATANTASTVRIKLVANGVTIGAVSATGLATAPAAAATSISLGYSAGYVLNAGEALVINLSTAQDCSYSVFYYEESV